MVVAVVVVVVVMTKICVRIGVNQLNGPEECQRLIEAAKKLQQIDGLCSLLVVCHVCGPSRAIDAGVKLLKLFSWCFLFFCVLKSFCFSSETVRICS